MTGNFLYPSHFFIVLRIDRVLIISSKKKLAKFNLASLNDRDGSADADYWLKYENLIDDKKNKLWDAMLYSLQKYQ